MENRPYCKIPIILRSYKKHIIATLIDFGFHKLFFEDSYKKFIMVHHNYIIPINIDKIPDDAIDCRYDTKMFFKEIIGQPPTS